MGQRGQGNVHDGEGAGGGGGGSREKPVGAPGVGGGSGRRPSCRRADGSDPPGVPEEAAGRPGHATTATAGTASPPPSWSFLPYFWLKTEIPALFRGRVMPNANIPEVNFSLQGTSFGNKELEYFFAIGEFP